MSIKAKKKMLFQCANSLKKSKLKMNEENKMAG
jgi:hypothetical protein